ncbi:MAG: hypothetical protein KIH69_014185 [Anaerolineae bacterium]|nr:hypothetical protein [Anaerolineae bacterium]
MINFFMYAFGLEGYWQKIEQCGLQHLAQQRQATYAGPKLDALNLPDEDKLVLVEMLTPVG